MEPAKPHPQFSDMYSEVIVSSSAGKNYLLECFSEACVLANVFPKA